MKADTICCISKRMTKAESLHAQITGSGKARNNGNGNRNGNENGNGNGNANSFAVPLADKLSVHVQCCKSHYAEPHGL